MTINSIIIYGNYLTKYHCKDLKYIFDGPGRQYQSFFIPHKTNEMEILSEILVIMIIMNMQIIFKKDTLHKIVEKNVNEGNKTTII